MWQSLPIQACREKTTASEPAPVMHTRQLNRARQKQTNPTQHRSLHGHNEFTMGYNMLSKKLRKLFSRKDTTQQEEIERRQLLLEQLEGRVLFDAVPDGSVEILEQFTGSSSAQVDQNTADQLATTSTDTGLIDQSKEVIFVDRRVPEYEALVAELLADRDANIEFIDSDEDGVLQITQALQGYDHIEAIHIISHGSEGEVALGNNTLSSDNISQYADELAGWADALTEDADLLFYGCDLAGNQEGQQFIETISAMTGADVAASDDLTGAAELGADWDLEVEVGQIDTTSLRAENWDGHLNLPPTVDIDADDSGVNPGTFPDAEITSVNNTGESVTGTLGDGVNVGANFSATRGVLLGASPDIVVDVVDGTNNTISIALQDDATSPETNEAVRVAVDINPLPNTNVTSFIFRPSADVDIKAGTLTFFFEGEATLHDPDNQVSSDNDGDAVLNTDALVFDNDLAAGEATWFLEVVNPFGTFEFLFEGEDNGTPFGTPTFEIEANLQATGFITGDYIENGAPITVANDVSLAFNDSSSTGDFGRLRIHTSFPDGAEEQLHILGEAFNLNSAPGTIDVGGVTFNVSRFPLSGFGAGSGFDVTRTDGGRISFAQAEQIFESVQYSHTSEHPAAGIRTIGFQVVDQFVNNPREFSRVANAEINVIPVNDVPVAVDDGDIRVAAGVPVVIDPVGINDFDVDLDPLTIVSASSPDGTVVIQSDNTLVFTPNAGFSGTGVVSYTVADPFGATSTANVVVSDVAVNQKPDAGTNQTLEGDENTPGGTVVATLGASDPDGDPLIYRITRDTSGGLFVVSGDDLIVRPGTSIPDFESLGDRTWEVTVRVTDPQADTDTVTVTINFNDIFEEIFLDNGNNTFTDRGDQGDTIIGLNGDDTIQGDIGDNRIFGDSPVEIFPSNLIFPEALMAGDVLANLSATGTTGPFTFSIQNDPDGLLEIVGTELRATQDLNDADTQQLFYTFALGVTDDVATHVQPFTAQLLSLIHI